MKYIMILVCLFIFAGCSNQQDQGAIREYNGEVIREDYEDTLIIEGKKYPMRGIIGDFTVSDADFLAGKKQKYTFYIWFGDKKTDIKSLNQEELVKWKQVASAEKQKAMGKQITFTAIESETFEKRDIGTGIIESISEEEKRFPFANSMAKVTTEISLPSKGIWKLEANVDGQIIGNVTIKAN